jgi:hypothetical protein
MKRSPPAAVVSPPVPLDVSVDNGAAVSLRSVA